MVENPIKAVFSEYFKDGVSFIQRLSDGAFTIDPDNVQKEVEHKRGTRTKKYAKSLCNVVRHTLNDRYCRIGSPGLKLALFPHQETALAAMLEIEHKRVITFKNGYKIAYNAAVYSDPPGVGKTITVLALIKLSPTPRMYPDINILPIENPSMNSVASIRTRYKTILHPTLIFMGSSVIKQWEQAITQFTDLKYFSVYTIKELRKLLELMAESSRDHAAGINLYDIVLVKNGKITRKLEGLPLGIPLNSCNRTAVSYIYNVLANMNMTFKRCAYDDFDTVILPENATTIFANFTWLISSTRKTARDYGGQKYESKLTTAGRLATIKYGCGTLVKNSVLFQLLNVRNSIEYICSTAQQNIIKYHLVKSKNHAAAVINMIGDLKSDEKFMEMLNGDAFKQAANAVGMSEQPIVNIFISILGHRYKEFRTADVALKRANDIENIIDILPDLPDGHKKTFSKKEFMSLEVPEYRYNNLKTLVSDIRAEYIPIYNDAGKAIERTKANLREGECIICFTAFKDAGGIIINKCCCSAFCDSCGYTMQKFADRFQGKGTCAKCRRDLSIKDLIYIDKNFDIEAILNNQFEDEKEESSDEKSPDVADAGADNAEDVLPEELPDVKVIATDEGTMVFSCVPYNNEAQTTRDEWMNRIKQYKETHPERPKDKYEHAINIIHGHTEPCEDQRFDISILNISQGAHYTVEPAIRKVLIFANFKETLDNTKAALTAAKIIFWELFGGYRELTHIANSFTACNQPCALVINSTLRCSGLNLQTATDLIFMHKIIDPNMETQVIGRGHRIGRTSSLNVWYNLYEDEIADMKGKYHMRFLTDSEIVEEKDFEMGKKVHVINSVQGADAENKHEAPQKSDGKLDKSPVAKKVSRKPAKKVARKPRKIESSSESDDDANVEPAADDTVHIDDANIGPAADDTVHINDDDEDQTKGKKNAPLSESELQKIWLHTVGTMEDMDQFIIDENLGPDFAEFIAEGLYFENLSAAQSDLYMRMLEKFRNTCMQ